MKNTMKTRKEIEEIIHQMQMLQCDQQHQLQVYPISDAINALKWVLGEAKNDKLLLGCCSCRWPDFQAEDRIAIEKKNVRGPFE